MKIRRLLAITTLLCLTATSVRADIFKCVDTNGHVMYSNLADKNCKKLSLEPVPSAPPAAKAAASKAPTPSTFPRVDDNAQKARDADRRRILDSELGAEQKNLEQAKKDLAEQESIILPSERLQGGAFNGAKVQERVQAFKDKVALHERNIEAIQKEISKLR